MGVEESRKTRFDLGEELSDVLITFEQKIYNKHLDVRVDLPDKPVWTRAERDSITQVIYNLIDNAIKFCPDGGRLALRLQLDGGKARVTVENTGPTIDKTSFRCSSTASTKPISPVRPTAKAGASASTLQRPSSARTAAISGPQAKTV